MNQWKAVCNCQGRYIWCQTGGAEWFSTPFQHDIWSICFKSISRIIWFWKNIVRQPMAATQIHKDKLLPGSHRPPLDDYAQTSRSIYRFEAYASNVFTRKIIAIEPCFSFLHVSQSHTSHVLTFSYSHTHTSYCLTVLPSYTLRRTAFCTVRFGYAQRPGNFICNNENNCFDYAQQLK